MTLLSIILLVAAFFAATVSGYIVEIPAKNQECFFENLTKYERMISSFEVLAGGMLDINIKVRSVCIHFYCPRTAASSSFFARERAAASSLLRHPNGRSLNYIAPLPHAGISSA
jgi:hypothetical protein